MSCTDSPVGSPRLFCALVWPEPEIAPLQALQQAVRAGLPEAALHWTVPQDLHLTLRYFGDTGAALRSRLAAAVADLAGMTRVLQLDLLRLETWPPIRPRVLVARFRGEPALARLQAGLEREARQLGLAPEPHRFQPHVTLARAGTGWHGSLVRSRLPQLRLTARDIALWHRAPEPARRRYAELARWALAPAPAHDQ